MAASGSGTTLSVLAASEGGAASVFAISLSLFNFMFFPKAICFVLCIKNWMEINNMFPVLMMTNGPPAGP
jgi:hypothetical protein